MVLNLENQKLEAEVTGGIAERGREHFFFPETGGVTRFAAFCCSTTSEKTTQQRERERSDLDQRKELQKQKVKVNVLLLNNNSYDQDQRM